MIIEEVKDEVDLLLFFSSIRVDDIKSFNIINIEIGVGFHGESDGIFSVFNGLDAIEMVISPQCH